MNIRTSHSHQWYVFIFLTEDPHCDWTRLSDTLVLQMALLDFNPLKWLLCCLTISDFTAKINSVCIFHSPHIVKSVYNWGWFPKEKQSLLCWSTRVMRLWWGNIVLLSSTPMLTWFYVVTTLRANVSKSTSVLSSPSPCGFSSHCVVMMAAYLARLRSTFCLLEKMVIR